MDEPLRRSGSDQLGPLWHGHGARLGVGLLCLVGLALSTSAYAFLAGPVVQLLLTGAAPRPGAMLSSLPFLPRLPSGTGPGLLWIVAALLVGIAVLKGLCQLGASLLLDGTSERIGVQLRRRLYGHLLGLPLAAHRQLATGDVLVRLLDDVRRVQESLLSAPLALVREGLAAAGLAAVAIGTAPGLALLALVVLPAAGVLIGALGTAVKRAAAGAQEQLGQLSARASQGLTAIREVKSCGAEERELDRVGTHATRALNWTLRHLRARAVGPLVNEVLAALGLGAVLVHAGDRVARGVLAPERFLSFFTALLLLYRPIKEIGRAFHQRAAGRASLERVRSLLRYEAEAAPAPGSALAPLQRSLSLEAICFSYTAGGSAILDGLRLELPAGKVVAVTGPSGVGKSTLVNVVCGLEPPSSGRLLWDGEEIGAAASGRLRAAVALVPQQPLMFDDTIEENLRYGAPGADRRAVERALADTALAARIAELPDGIATRLGPGGVQLSVGETQRLALGRALLRAASLIVLDEPTSALDAANQEHLMSTVRHVAAAGRAVLLVAHSARLLSAADEAWELSAGKLTPRAAGR